MAKKNAREKLMQELLAPEYRLKCEYAIHIIELKLEMLMEQFYVECGRPVISNITSRIKSVEVPIYTQEGCEKKRVEIQFRTVAMDFWAQLDYQLCYKKNIEEKTSQQIQKKLAKYADEMAGIDRQMMRLRRQIEKLGTNTETKENR